jgi:hypothetical protein
VNALAYRATKVRGNAPGRVPTLSTESNTVRVRTPCPCLPYTPVGPLGEGGRMKRRTLTPTAFAEETAPSLTLSRNRGREIPIWAGVPSGWRGDGTPRRLRHPTPAGVRSFRSGPWPHLLGRFPRRPTAGGRSASAVISRASIRLHAGSRPRGHGRGGESQELPCDRRPQDPSEYVTANPSRSTPRRDPHRIERRVQWTSSSSGPV